MNNMNSILIDKNYVERNLLFREEYINKSFEDSLIQGKIFEKDIVRRLKKIFPSSDYIIIDNFDMKYIINFFKMDNFIINKYYKFLFKTMQILSPKTYTPYQIKNRLTNLRGHDIAIFNKKKKIIEYLIEAKDIGQLIYYYRTGLPKYYIFKLTVIKKILEHLQYDIPIKQFLFFKDNDSLEKEREKRNINIPLIKDSNGHYIPYGFFITEEELKQKKIAVNSKEQIIPSFFIIKKRKNRNNFYKEATHQLLWDLNERIYLEDILSL